MVSAFQTLVLNSVNSNDRIDPTGTRIFLPWDLPRTPRDGTHPVDRLGVLPLRTSLAPAGTRQSRALRPETKNRFCITPADLTQSPTEGGKEMLTRRIDPAPTRRTTWLRRREHAKSRPAPSMAGQTSTTHGEKCRLHLDRTALCDVGFAATGRTRMDRSVVKLRIGTLLALGVSVCALVQSGCGGVSTCETLFAAIEAVPDSQIGGCRDQQLALDLCTSGCFGSQASCSPFVDEVNRACGGR